MSAATPERRTAMYHAQLAMGALMSDADGWQLPAHYGDLTQEATWLRQTVAISDASSIGKIRVVGKGATQAVQALLPHAANLPVGAAAEADSPLERNAVAEANSPLERGGKLLAARLTPDEFLLLTPPNQAPAAIDALLSRNPAGSPETPAPCAHAVDLTSGLCGVAIIGPATPDLLSRVTGLDVSPRALPDLACVQTRIAEIRALLLRRDAHAIPILHLYATRDLGEYLWQTLTQAAQESGGGPAGTQALLGLRSAN